MKKLSVFLIAVLTYLASANAAQAQWQFLGNNIRNTNSGDVIIGSTTQSRGKLTIFGGITFSDQANFNKTMIMGHNDVKRYVFLSPWDFGPGEWLNLFIGGEHIGMSVAPDPNYKLRVGGSIRAASITVDETKPWPDFVFNDDYELMPLEDLDQYIRTNRHLPDMPGAAQASAQGLNVGEIQAKLLQKIEELTLYIIEQDKKIARLEGQIQSP